MVLETEPESALNKIQCSFQNLGNNYIIGKLGQKPLIVFFVE